MRRAQKSRLRNKVAQMRACFLTQMSAMSSKIHQQRESREEATAVMGALKESRRWSWGPFFSFHSCFIKQDH